MTEIQQNGQLHTDASQYVRNVMALHGIAGLEREARRLVHKLDVAASLYREGATREFLMPARGIEQRIAHAVETGAAGMLGIELDALQNHVVEAQRKVDPAGRAALVLHVDEVHWERCDSYEAYQDRFRIFEQD